MKIFAAAATLFAFALPATANTIIIRPGQAILVTPSTPTTVTCSGAADDQRKVVSKYCLCSFGALESGTVPDQKGYRLHQVLTWNDGTEKRSLVEEYEVERAQCESAKSTHAACRAN